MNIWMVMNQVIYPKVSAYSPAYLDAENVFILPSIMTKGKDKVIYEIKDVKI